jgi:NitT/TauT family transport system permease protein
MRKPSRRTIVIHAIQVLLVVAFLLLWEYLPKAGDLAHKTHFLNPFFISSPSRVYNRLSDLFAGKDGVDIWHYIWSTFGAALIGTAIGMSLGFACGVLLSSSDTLSRIFHPFIVAINAIPRIALIPIIIILFGLGFKTSIVVAVLVCFFVAFFNSYEGGRVVAPAQLHSARILGASELQLIVSVRMRYALAWTLAALPLGITFAVLSVVTGEVLTGYAGLGRLLLLSTSSADSTLTFSVVVILSVLTLVVVGIAELIKKKILHWWVEGRAT